ncbi:hypothetical protein PSP6_320016 [Paraburkholderia tropica]|nr:hypothetical protein PSP6_320016 [Paraburkholderia tropica]
MAVTRHAYLVRVPAFVFAAPAGQDTWCTRARWSFRRIIWLTPARPCSRLAHQEHELPTHWRTNVAVRDRLILAAEGLAVAGSRAHLPSRPRASRARGTGQP